MKFLTILYKQLAAVVAIVLKLVANLVCYDGTRCSSCVCCYDHTTIEHASNDSGPSTCSFG